MHDWLMDGWGMGLGFVFWVALLVLIIAAALWFVRSQTTTSDGTERRSGGLNVLDERYARGEIEREEYLQARLDRLSGHLVSVSELHVRRWHAADVPADQPLGHLLTLNRLNHDSAF